MKKYIIILSLLCCIVSCKKGITDVTETINYGPLDDVEVSQGNTWTSTSALPDTGNSIYSVNSRDVTVNSSNNIFVATNFGGIFCSIDNGSTWTVQKGGFAKDPVLAEYNYDAVTVSAICSLGKCIFAGTDSAIYISQNNGETWTKNKDFNDYKVVNLFKLKNKGELYAGCYHGIFKTNNYGADWTDISTGINWSVYGYALDLEFTSDGALYIATAKGLIKTTDDGKSWTYFGIQDQIQDVEVDGNGYIYAASYSKLYISKDSGTIWQQIFQDNSGMNVDYVMVNKSNTIFVCCSSGLYRSTDYGNSWTLIGFENYLPKKIIYDNYGRLIVVTWRKGIYISQE
ncbi:MAG: hypothetical protein P4L45_09125 [Ignavibacteriaceae bacterium]|nr:hypothetical protein [Ignavibacteriaceae bacterium]